MSAAKPDARLAELIDLLAGSRQHIDEWFAAEFAKQHPPFYASVDIRVSSHKMAPVDVNLFPGGFNNLDAAAIERAAGAAGGMLERAWPGSKRLLVLAEAHTRNPHYVDNLAVLGRMLEMAGVEVRFACLGAEPLEVSGSDGKSLHLASICRRGRRIEAAGFDPDALLLNNDLAAGTPKMLLDIEQPKLPPLAAGWSQRRKSAYFFQYERVATRFAHEFGFDPWLIDAFFNVCTRVDVARKVGMDCLAAAVAETLDDIRSNFAGIGSEERPFVVIKADAGTYGMGVVMLDEADQVHSLNRRQRSSLASGKDGLTISDILIQEGIPTIELVDGFAAEEAHYCVGDKVIGSFWRFNQRKSDRENLNSQGMGFACRPESEAANARRQASETVAALALLAAGREFAGDLAA
ncbi:MAG: glutamate--cysteine ligase [Betaproteobacteria bacterium]|nr:glutamate--cysteine ligase [Betaproteobacteria bacterium]